MTGIIWCKELNGIFYELVQDKYQVFVKINDVFYKDVTSQSRGFVEIINHINGNI